MTVTWNQSGCHSAIELSAGNLTGTSTGGWIGLAIDFDAGKIWVYNPATPGWNSDATGSTQNPSTPVGGYTWTPTGPFYPAVSLYYGTTGLTDTQSVNFGASAFKFSVPSGYSSWNTAAGETTWNPSDKSALLTLSDGNLTATRNGGSASYGTVRGTTSLSTGKVYFESRLNYVNTGYNGFLIGLANSGASLTNYIGSDTSKSFGWQPTGAKYGASNNIAAYNGWITHWRSCRADTGYSSGKYYFEFKANAQSATPGLLCGVADNTAAILDNYVGGSTHGYSYQSAKYWYNAGSTAGDSFATSVWLGVAVDIGAAKVWFYNPTAARWNSASSASQDPATGTGGFSISALSTPIYPAFSLYDWNAADQLTANFGATAFSNTVPSGFTAWESAAGFMPAWAVQATTRVLGEVA